MSACLLLLAGALALGCRDREAANSGAKDSVARPDKAAARPEVKLLVPGAEPRRTLRYRLREGAEERLIMRMNLAIQTATNGVPVPEVETPAVSMDMQLRVAETSDDEQARYDFALSAIEVEETPGVLPEVAAAMRERFQNVAGLTGSARVDSRGFNWDARMNLPEQLAPEVRQLMLSAAQSMDQVSAPLPEEAVGEGARWSLTQTIEQNEVTLEQVTHFELIELDGDRGVLTTRISQRAGAQAMHIQDMPAGTAELLSLESNGSGRIYFDLGRLVPRSSLDMRSDYGLRVTPGDGEAVQHIDTHVDMRIELAAP
ncbi:hypothetical protein [Haliangium ochraceum]|nr:hypothetical protein [Haliangium ochraceum]